MAGIGDIISFILTFSLFAGVIAGGMYVSRMLNESVATTKQTLKEKGVDITENGTVRVKTKGMSHEAYVDATQRAFIDGAKRMQAAGSFGHADDIYAAGSPGSPSSSPTPSRSNTFPLPRSSSNSSSITTPRRKDSAGAQAPSSFRSPMSPGTLPRSASIGSIESEPEEKKKKGIFGHLKRRSSDKRKGTAGST